MIKVLFPLPKQIYVAFSGGVDSVAIVDFLSKKHDVTCAFFHHGTKNSDRAYEFVSKYCTLNNLPLMVGFISKDKPKSLSLEEHWRIERYKFLNPLDVVVTGHHLDDCVETYIWSSLHGKPKIPNLIRGNVLRPFLTTKKSELIDWCTHRNLTWCEDLSNEDVKYTRNYIRKNLMPHALKVNPGLHKVIRKLVEKSI